MKNKHDRRHDNKGAPPKPIEEHCMQGRFMVNLPPIQTERLRAAAKRQGLPVSAYMRQAVLNRIDQDEKS